ncbi:hypothetical protein TPHA_0C04780 [Tetrapisispora phaffii CBS 4417]|uniref:Vanadate resistance protein n=1 Tax=Tetrapisispora phaffii (strain ATCC 24235 / CBS 4417 / NBRC 1672 / NRRL Y-8282 / UCD 70-5) TaxID=1071381 RepID=G8BQW5_TETPH|nr:hypothetical protein TPHA_0C04780 [Tetrapisispora phaffii CBS 4417]CCE62627.1 hypothetical protein TPHA_0C04780 [Tetrapisispora phaffii CBS 4417]
MKFSPLKLFRFSRNSYKLPLSEKTKEKRKNRDFRLLPKYSKFKVTNFRDKVSNFNVALSVILLCIFIAKTISVNVSIYKYNSFVHEEETETVTFDTQVLTAPEYYNYDFHDYNLDTISKYDKGVRQYLLDTYKTDDVSQLSVQAKEAYDAELPKLLSSSVDIYDMKDFSGTSHGVSSREHVLLCIPLRDAEDVLPLMFKNLMNLTYPHELIDVAFLVSDCSENDHTLESLLQYTRFLQNGTLPDVFEEMDKLDEMTDKVVENADDSKLYLKYMKKEYLQRVKEAFKSPFHENYDKPFRSIQIYKKDFGQTVGQSFSDRHDVKVQGIRRKLMGRARNWLMTNALKPYHSWVYWRDADVELCPGTVIEDLMSKDFDVIVPNVWRPLPEFMNSEQPYDLNSWMESREAIDLAKKLHEDEVIVEGYAEYPTWRVHLAYLREKDGDPNQVVDVDGVGGVSILARARLFRAGVHFPAFTFENHAETEAFGKMAKKMGFRVGGLPHYTLWHIYEPSDDDLMAIATKEKERTA